MEVVGVDSMQTSQSTSDKNVEQPDGVFPGFRIILIDIFRDVFDLFQFCVDVPYTIFFTQVRYFDLLTEIRWSGFGVFYSVC